MIYKNESKSQLMRLIFSDKDVFHLLPGESYNCPKFFTVVKTMYVEKQARRG